MPSRQISGSKQISLQKSRPRDSLKIFIPSIMERKRICEDLQLSHSIYVPSDLRVTRPEEDKSQLYAFMRERSTENTRQHLDRMRLRTLQYFPS